MWTSSGDSPIPPPPQIHHALFSIVYLAGFKLRLSVVYKSIKVHLGQSQEQIMSIHICKYTYKNAGFCILCINDFKILKIFIKLSKFSTLFQRETAPTSPSSNVHMTFLVDKIDMGRFPRTKHECYYLNHVP